MTLGDKVRYLREVEGTLRGLGRGMNQSEVSRAVRQELGSSITQAYLSQVENGKRKHLSDATRMLLARFFKVHPGYLVDDPEDYRADLQCTVPGAEDRLESWLIHGAERFAGDPEISTALLTLARHPDSRRCFLLLSEIVEQPGMADRLTDLLPTKSVPSTRRRENPT